MCCFRQATSLPNHLSQCKTLPHSNVSKHSRTLMSQNTPALQCLKTFLFAGLSPTANFAQQSQRPDRFNMSVPASDLKSGLPESSSASDKPDVDTGAENGTSSNAERSHAYVGSVTSLVSMHAEEQCSRTRAACLRRERRRGRIRRSVTPGEARPTPQPRAHLAARAAMPDRCVACCACCVRRSPTPHRRPIWFFRAFLHTGHSFCINNIFLCAARKSSHG